MKNMNRITDAGFKQMLSKHAVPSMRFLAISILCAASTFSALCVAQTTYNFTITPASSASYVFGGAFGPIQGTVTLPSGCAPSGTCAASSIVLTSLPSSFVQPLVNGNTPTNWPVQRINSFTVTSGVITTATYQSASHNSWGAAYTAGQTMNDFEINTTGTRFPPATPGAIQLPATYIELGQIPPSTASVTFEQGLGGLGAELAGPTGWTSTGWTGGWNSSYNSNFFTHTPGNTSPLTNSLSTTAGDFYYVGVTIFGASAGSVSVSLGGVTVGTFSGNTTNVLNTGVASAGAFSITPTSDFNGTVNISVKPFTDGIQFN